MIIAHGIDLVNIEANRPLLTEPSAQWLTRCFTAHEQASAGTGIDQLEKLSSRFAVKEAVMKALGTGFGNGVGFLDVEVVTTVSGAPSVTLHGRARAIAEALGITNWLVSTSHETGFAMASVIALGA